MLVQKRRILATLLFAILTRGVWSSSLTPSSGMILRIRLGNGSIEKVQVAPGKETSITLSKLVERYKNQEEEQQPIIIRVGNKLIKDDSQTLEKLGLKHGSMISLSQPKKKEKDSATKPTIPSFRQDKKRDFDPFPDLAKDYTGALQKKARKRAGVGGMSYGALADLASSLHVVEPQAKGPVERIYICRVSAERFQRNSNGKGSTTTNNKRRIGLLLGTLSRERKDQHRPKKVSTSLSSTPRAEDFVKIAKVHAIWEPPSQKVTALLGTERVKRIAEWLDLRPLGWIFSYPGDKQDRFADDGLPLWSQEVVDGAHLQMERMKNFDRLEGKPFVSLAMDSSSGSTEAFQLSDVSVQMVAEDMLRVSDDDKTTKKNGRFVETQHPILVDGKETTNLDTVLCLINTAMLAHEGLYSGHTSASTTKKSNGGLTAKAKKALVACLNDDSKLLNKLCDFSMLVALDAQLPQKDMQDLCRLVQKWARGQKKGTVVGKKLKVSLETLLST